MMDITLNSARSKSQINKDMELRVPCERHSKLFPATTLDTTLNLSELYSKEREASDLVRLTCVITPMCSNPIFNRCTEIVKQEGSNSCKVLNYNPASGYNHIQSIPGTYGKPSNFKWDAYEGVRDTQLSNEKCGFTYHCGYDIFNNHILRSKYFCSVNKMPTYGTTTHKDFNTIDDTGRDGKGNAIINVYDNDPNAPGFVNKLTPATGSTRLYTSDDVFTFPSSIANNLSEHNGWFGFYNKNHIMVNELYDQGYVLHRVINNRSANDFIEMYPDSSLYSFVPKYNYARNRAEKNWKYYITYPRTSTQDVYFIDKTTKGLLATAYDDLARTSSTLVYSIAKHGLKVGDTVNVYVNGDLEYPFAKVLALGNGTEGSDDFVFAFANNGIRVTEDWGIISDSTENTDSVSTYYEYDSTRYRIHTNRTRVSFINPKTGKEPFGDDSFVIDGDRFPINIDDTTGEPLTNTISFKKVSDGAECEYYVRIFTKLPNFKFAKEAITDETANDFNVIKKYVGGNSKYNIEQFSSENTKLAFSRNIFNDLKAQIVFLEDIDLAHLKDNLGRPLTDLYLTIVKANKGHDEWYENYNFTSSEIEFSHCFGRVTGGFINSRLSLQEDSIPNVLKNSYDIPGILTSDINGGEETDEVLDETQCNFYGDLCCFDKAKFTEEVLLDYYMRFNTAQREAVDRSNVFMTYFDEIEEYPSAASDGHSMKYNGYTLKDDSITPSADDLNILANKRDKTREGYIYKAHMRIPIHGMSEELEEQQPKIFNTVNVIYTTKVKQCTTTELNYLQVGDKFMFYNLDNMRYATARVESLLGTSYTSFTYSVIDGDMSEVMSTSNIAVLKPDVTIPSYAAFVNDGSYRFVWRHFVKNGTGESQNTNVIKFANGRFYATPEFTFYLRRQDPYGIVEEYTPNSIVINSASFETVYTIPNAETWSFNLDWFADGDLVSCATENGD